MKGEQIIELVNAVSQSVLTEFEYEEGTVKLSLRKNSVPVVATEAIVTTATMEAVIPTTSPVVAVPSGQVVKSPLVGTFYVAPSAEAEPFAKVGDTVAKGQVLGIVEAMKLMNEIESECAGTIAEILVQNGETVEYGQSLFIIK